jgi:putative membrane protein
MQNTKRFGWLAASASMLLLGAMGFAQSSTSSDESGRSQGNPGSSATTMTGSASGGQRTTGTTTSDQIGANNDSARTGGVTTKDHTFMVKAAQGGLAEVQLGQLAQQNGQSQQVKDFGKKMVDDHSKAIDQLKHVASQKGVTLPTEPNAKDKAEYDRLSKLQGDAFDKAYSKAMLTDHKKDVAEFQKEANSGTDPDVKSFAGQTLPTLQDHPQMAQQLSGNNKSASNAQSSPTAASTAHP